MPLPRPVRSARLAATALLAAVAAGCGWGGVGLPGATPPTPGGPPADVTPAMDHEIRYDVFCQKCEAAYTTGSELKVVEVTGTWSTTVRLEYPSVQYATLRAHPTTPGGFVRRLRIYVDGTPVAEAERSGRDEISDEVLISAALPTTPVRPGVVKIR